MSKLVLIDGNAVLHRAYHALPPLTTKRGEPINAVYGLVSMLLRVISDLKPTHIAVAFDRKEKTFRQEIFEKYQAQRPIMDNELSGQFEKARDVLSAMNIPIFDRAGFEADDLLGSICNRTRELDISSVVIVTGDKDIMQLVDERVRVYLPVRGMSEAKLMGIKEVKEKLGVNPHEIPDYKALVGDPSDNYPGVSGIGPKTAIKLIEEYKTIDNIYKHLDSIPEKLRIKLNEGKDSAYLSLKLATIVKDLDVNINLENTKKWRIDSRDLLDLFSDYGFKTLTKRVKDVGKIITDENQMKLL